MPPVNQVVAIGAKAHAALRASRSIARPLAAFPDAPYYEADGVVIWVGARLPAMHPRAVLTAKPVARGHAVSFGTLPPRSWTANLPAPAYEVAAGLRRLLDAVAHLGEPRGFGTLLVGRAPAFPLHLAVERVRALANAFAANDPAAAYDSSCALLGVGGGLTPSGDDLAGGAIFGRLLVAAERAPWCEVGRRIAARAHEASHAISAALLADLTAGVSFAPLHTLADALAQGDSIAAFAAARELAALGHSSGWDMLVGLTIGVTGELGH